MPYSATKNSCLHLRESTSRWHSGTRKSTRNFCKAAYSGRYFIHNLPKNSGYWMSSIRALATMPGGLFFKVFCKLCAMITSMGFFDSNSKPHVSAREFHDMRARLSSKEFTEEEIDRTAMIFRADLDEPESTQTGIDASEVDRGIAWMRTNAQVHRISSEKISTLEKLLKEKL